MARVGLNGHLDRMKGRSIGMNSDEEDGVQSGSATGFSDGEREENAHLRGSKQIKNAFDPVTQILDKIDAELVSLTRSQGSTSTATTATDCTVVHRSSSRNSPAPHTNGHITHNGYPDNRDELSISQLGSSNYKHPGSLQSSSSRFPGGSDRDTGIGTGSNSLQETSLINKEPEIRPLEPGDHFKEKSVVGHRRANTAPAPLMFLNGQHLSDDDKHQQQSTSATLQAKQVDDKFREILQKRKSGRVSDTDDAQTIRTEDFVDKFQDTMVYSSADEAEKIRSLEDDLHSDGGSDTDTLQCKLAYLSRTPYPTLCKFNDKDFELQSDHNGGKDGKTSPRPSPRPLVRPKPKVATSFEMRPRKAPAPGYPPIYPKPTVTSSLPRPSVRSSLKLTTGHISDADSVRTEDFEHSFKDMMVPTGNQTESDLDTANTDGGNDPIHSKVKQLLKATAKYRISHNSSPSSNSILKTRSSSSEDKPKSDHKSKQHVRISPQLPQYQNQSKGEDSDDTLCSDKEDKVISPRERFFAGKRVSEWDNFWPPANKLRKSESLEESLSRSTHSLSSYSSSDNKKQDPKPKKFNFEVFNDIITSTAPNISSVSRPLQKQVTKLSNSRSAISEFRASSSSNSGGMISTNESMFDSSSSISASTADTRSRNFQTGKDHCFSQTKPFDNNVSMGKRRSAFDSKVPYVSKKEVDSAGNKKKEKRRRDLIIQDEDEEDQYPYAKVTFNKKSDKALKRKEDKDSMSSSSRSLQSQDSIYSVGLMNQYMALNHRHKSLKTKDSSSSLTSMTSSLNDMSFAESSAFDSTRSGSVESADVRQKFNPFPYMNRKPGPFPFMATNSACTHRYPLEPQTAFQNYGMYNYQSTIAAMGHKPNPETVFADLSFSEASAILPERFMKSWFEKVYINQQEEYFRTMVHPQMPLPNMPSTFYSSYYEDDIDLPPSVSAHQSGYNTPAMTRSLENIHAQVDAQKGYQKLQNRTIRRSNSLMTKISSRNSFDYSNLEHNEVDEEILSKVGPLPLQKENSFDKLRRILQTKEMPIYKDRSERRSVFAANHQKSLPIFLETLNEEDEERRRSRTPSVEKRYSETSLKKQNNSQVIQREMIISTAGSDSFSSDSRKSSVFNTIHGNLLQCSVEHEGNNEFNTVYSDDGEKDMQELGIPSIVVSQKYSDDELKSANEILCITPMRSLSNERKGSISRPSSPITVNELGEENQSKYSLEIDEIFSPKEKNSKLAYVINVQKIDSVSPTNETDDLFMERVDVKSHLSARARDEKLLSPTSSVYSPNMMSPITVIEAVHLDNTKDCDANGKKESESLEKTSDISSEGREKSVPAGENNSFSFNPFAKKLLKTNKHSNAPKCLQLKRHLTNSREGQPTNVTFGNIAQPVVKQEIKHDSRTNQSQLEDLPPIITFPNIADLLEEILHHMPPVQSNSPVPMTSENCPDCRHYEDNIENLQVKRNVSHLIKDHVMSHNDMTHEGKQTLDQICQTDTTRFELLRHRAVNLLDLILQDIQYGQLESCLCFNKNYSTVRQMSHSCIQTEKKFRSEVNLYVTQPVYRSEFQMDINTSDVRKQNLNVKINEKPSCDGWEKAFDQQYKENSETTEATQHDDGDYKVFLDAQSENECEEPHMDYGANNSEVRMQYIRIKSLSVSRIDFENAESEDVHKLIECEENFYKDNDILQSQLSFIGCQQIQADSKNMYSNTYPLETVQDSAHRETGNEMSTFECDEYLPVQTPRAWVEKGSKNEGLNKSLPTYGSDSKDEIKRTETAKFKNMFGFEEKQSNLFYVETEHNSNVNGIGYQTPTTVLDNEKVITRKRTFQRSKNTEEEGSEMNIGSVQDLNIENILVQDGEQEYVESASLKTKIAQVVSVKPEHKLAINIVDALNHCEQNNNTESISLMRTPAEHVSKAPKPVSQSELGYRFSEENDCYHMFTKLKVSIDTDTVDYGNEPLVQTNYSSMDIDKSSVKENANNESDNLEMSTPCVHSFDKYKHLCRNEDKSPSFNVSSNEQTGQSSHKSITPKLHSNTNEKSVWIVSKSFDGFQYGTGESQAEKEKIFVLSGTKHEYEVDKRQLKSRPYEYWDSLNEHRLVKSVDDFDMFQQIDEESEYEKEPETDLLSDAETKKTFEEIERLYKMSGHCGTNRYGNVTDMEDDVLECNPVPGNSHERFLMDENYDILDHETAQMEAYLNGSTCM